MSNASEPKCNVEKYYLSAENSNKQEEFSNFRVDPDLSECVCSYHLSERKV